MSEKYTPTAEEVRELIAEAREWPRDGVNEGWLINALADALEAATRERDAAVAATRQPGYDDRAVSEAAQKLDEWLRKYDSDRHIPRIPIVREMLTGFSRAAVTDAATEEIESLKDIAETHAFCADRLSIEKERADRIAREVCDRGCSYTGSPDQECSAHGRTPRELWGFIAQDVVGRDAATERAEKAEAERDAALAAVERVRAEASSVLMAENDPPNDWNMALDYLAKKVLEALDGAPEPEVAELPETGLEVRDGDGDLVMSGEHRKVLHQGGYVCDTCVNILGINVRWDRADRMEGHPLRVEGESKP